MSLNKIAIMLCTTRGKNSGLWPVCRQNLVNLRVFFFLQVVMIGLLKVQILYSVHRDNKGNYKKTEIVTFGCNLSVPRFVLPRLAST